MLLVGLGAVATTTIAGVFAIRKGIAPPIGSLTQMGTIRLGKRSEGRSPKINEFAPLAALDDIVFGGWDIFEEDCYAAACTAGVLDRALLDQIRPELESIKPMPAVFDQRYVKRLSGPNVKKGKNKKDLADQLIADIRNFKKTHNCDRMVMIWCGSTEVFMKEGPVHQSLAAFEKGLELSDDSIPSSMVYAYAALKEGLPFANAAPNLTADIPAMLELAASPFERGHAFSRESEHLEDRVPIDQQHGWQGHTNPKPVARVVEQYSLQHFCLGRCLPHHAP